MTESLRSKIDRLHAERDALDAQIIECYEQSLVARPEHKACIDEVAEDMSDPQPAIKYPVTISGIAFRDANPIVHMSRKSPLLVKVRPCDPLYSGKTYIGVYVGDVALNATCSLNVESGVLEVGLGAHNPAIWVPDLGRYVFGCESWWGDVKSADELRDISDKEIDDLWYVKAFKGMQSRTE